MKVKLNWVQVAAIVFAAGAIFLDRVTNNVLALGVDGNVLDIVKAALVAVNGVIAVVQGADPQTELAPAPKA